jgi:hypothetical protein
MNANSHPPVLRAAQSIIGGFITFPLPPKFSFLNPPKAIPQIANPITLSSSGPDRHKPFIVVFDAFAAASY